MRYPKPKNLELIISLTYPKTYPEKLSLNQVTRKVKIPK